MRSVIGDDDEDDKLALVRWDETEGD